MFLKESCWLKLGAKKRWNCIISYHDINVHFPFWIRYVLKTSIFVFTSFFPVIESHRNPLHCGLLRICSWTAGPPLLVRSCCFYCIARAVQSCVELLRVCSQQGLCVFHHCDYAYFLMCIFCCLLNKFTLSISCLFTKMLILSAFGCPHLCWGPAGYSTSPY